MGAGAKRRRPLWPAWALLALAMAPLFAGAWGAMPAADDFVYATRTHQTWVAMRSLPHVLVDAWRYSQQIYRNWQGTFVGALVMALNPAVFTLAGYGMHAWVLLAAYLAAQWALVRVVCKRVLGLDRPVATWAFVVLSALQWIWIPDTLEGLYWFNSAWFYTLAHAAWMLALTLALALPDAGTRRRKAGWALLWLLCAGLGLDNYITAMLAVCSLGLLCAALWSGQRRRALLLLPGVVLLACGLLISVLAPGNAVRLATETQFPKPQPWLINATWKTLLSALRLIWRFIVRTPLAACCVLVAPWLYNALQKAGRPCRRPMLMALSALLLLSAMVFPHLYSTGGAGSPRVINLYFFYCMLAGAFCCAYALGALGRRWPGRQAGRAAKWTCAGLAAALAAFSMWQVPPAAYPALVRDVLSGEVAAYREQTLAQFAQLAAAGPGSDMTVLPGPYAPPSVAYPPFTGDPAHWANVAIADYFDLHSVHLGHVSR